MRLKQGCARLLSHTSNRDAGRRRDLLNDIVDQNLGVYDGGFLRLWNRGDEDDELWNGRVETLDLRHQQRRLGNRPSRNSSEALIVVGVSLLENFHETGGAGVIHASTWRVIFDFVDTALGVDGVDYLACVGIHDH